jgi:hypothetical protein
MCQVGPGTALSRFQSTILRTEPYERTTEAVGPSKDEHQVRSVGLRLELNRVHRLRQTVPAPVPPPSQK